MNHNRRKARRLLELYFRFRATQGGRAIQLGANAFLPGPKDDPYRLLDDAINVGLLLFQMAPWSGPERPKAPKRFFRVHRRWRLTRSEWTGLCRVFMPEKGRKVTMDDHDACKRGLTKCTEVFLSAGLIGLAKPTNAPKMDFERTETGALRASKRQIIREISDSKNRIKSPL